MPKITIKNAGKPIGTIVEIDDQKVAGVRMISFEHEAGKVPRMTIEVLPTELVLEGDMEVERVTVCPSCKIAQAQRK